MTHLHDRDFYLPVFCNESVDFGVSGAMVQPVPPTSEAISANFGSPMKTFLRLVLITTSWATMAGNFSLAAPYDQRLGNLSSRAQVSTGNNIMITGFAVQEGAPKRILIRAVGARPSGAWSVWGPFPGRPAYARSSRTGPEAHRASRPQTCLLGDSRPGLESPVRGRHGTQYKWH